MMKIKNVTIAGADTSGSQIYGKQLFPTVNRHLDFLWSVGPRRDADRFLYSSGKHGWGTHRTIPDQAQPIDAAKAAPLSIGLSHANECHVRVDVESTERYIENKSNR